MHRRFLPHRALKKFRELRSGRRRRRRRKRKKQSKAKRSTRALVRDASLFRWHLRTEVAAYVNTFFTPWNHLGATS
jgi:hypothetical protein